MNMSYCQFENTLRAMQQVRNTMLEAQYIDDLDLNAYEAEAIKAMPALLEEMLDLLNELGLD